MRDGRSGRAGAAARFAKLAGWSALMAPVGIVLHELGHFGVARGFGFEARLDAASVSGGAELGRDPDWMVAAQAGAGPLVTIVLILFALYCFRRGRGRERERLWALALAATAPLRFIVGAAYLAVAGYVWWVGGTMDAGFDEGKFAGALGIALVPVLLVEMVLLAGLWVWLVRAIARGRRVLSIVAIALGAFAGIALWMSLGPALFERA